LTPEETALERYYKIRPFFDGEASLQQISETTNTAPRTLYNWVQAFKKNGLTGLAPLQRKDKGKRRAASEDIVQVIKGLYLKSPSAPVSAVYRTVEQLCLRNNWRVPSYDVVHDVASKIAPDLRTLAHEGDKAYQQAYELIHRREADRPNEIWQADHTSLDLFLIDSQERLAKPWLTAILDDYSRAIAGYYIGFEPPSSMRIGSALRQAIWSKDDPDWRICGIPEKLYSDCGSDFRSEHIEQVSIALKFELINTLPGKPQGKGKLERFFGTVNQMFLPAIPGFDLRKNSKLENLLTLREFDDRFRLWLIHQYSSHKHSETNETPSAKWESYSFVPRMPESIEQLDLLLHTVAKARKVHRDGIRFQGFRYFDVTLAGYVGEYVTIRYDPRNLTSIHVYADTVLVCHAICPELSDEIMSVKDVIKARRARKRELNHDIRNLLAAAERYIPAEKPTAEKPTPNYPKFKIKRFACDDD